LQVADIPRSLGTGYKKAGSTVTNPFVATADGVSTSSMNRYRITGYETTFARKPQLGASGTYVILDSVGLYKSPSGASWEYGKYAQKFRPPAGSHTVSMSGIGDQARGWSATTGPLSRVSLYFRRGSYNALVDLTALGTSPTSAALGLARVLDGRMHKAH
jgi:hypothetical protein